MDSSKAGFNAGPIYVFLASLCFSIGGLCIKYIPWNPLAINCARSIPALVLFYSFLKITGHRIHMNKAVLVGALCVSITNILYSTANKLTTAGNTIVLQYTAPVFVMLFSVLLFGKKPGRIDILTAAAVFAGVICFFIDSLSSGNMLGNLLALLCGVSYAGVFLMNSSEEADSMSSTLFGMILNLIIGLPFLLKTDLAASSAGTWAAILALGLIQVGLAYLFLNLGLKTTPAIAACLINGLEPILNPLLVAFFYGEVLTPLSIFGAAIVLVSIIAYNVIQAR